MINVAKHLCPRFNEACVTERWLINFRKDRDSVLLADFRKWYKKFKCD